VMFRLAASALLMAAACTSAVVGGQETLEQVDRAQLLQLQATLQEAAQAEEAYFAEAGTYTTDVGLLNINVPPEIGLTITQPTTGDYCIQGAHRSLEAAWHVSKTSPQPVEGEC
jgi:Tfp pilus assembly protein PilE